jgi:hypothetical protein
MFFHIWGNYDNIKRKTTMLQAATVYINVNKYYACISREHYFKNVISESSFVIFSVI